MRLHELIEQLTKDSEDALVVLLARSKHGCARFTGDFI